MRADDNPAAKTPPRGGKVRKKYPNVAPNDPRAFGQMTQEPPAIHFPNVSQKPTHDPSKQQFPQMSSDVPKSPAARDSFNVPNVTSEMPANVTAAQRRLGQKSVDSVARDTRNTAHDARVPVDTVTPWFPKTPGGPTDQPAHSTQASSPGLTIGSNAPELRSYARAMAEKYGVPADVFEAQIQQENRFLTGGSSPMGAQGIAQIMPDTAKAWGVDPNDPKAALEAAAQHMGEYIKKYGVEGALRAYNAGEGAIEKSKSYPETNNYVAKIMGATGSSAGGSSQDVPGSSSSSSSSSYASTTGGTPGTPADASRMTSLVDTLRRFNEATGSQGTPKYPGVAAWQQQQGQTTTPTLAAKTAPIMAALQATKTGFQQGDMSPGATGVSSSQATGALKQMLEEADSVDAAQLPYQYGGGHSSSNVRGGAMMPLDCSAAVSRVLGIDVRDSTALMNYGEAGKGQKVTIYANSGHTLMEIDGHFFGTSGSNPNGGAGWIPREAISPSYLRNFTVRHPKGM